MKDYRALVTIVIAFMCVSCGGGSSAITDCDARGDVRPICGMKTPEDMAVLPDGRQILLAHYGGMYNGTGSLAVFDSITESITPLFPMPNPKAEVAAIEWGDGSCERQPGMEFSPHGTHLHQLADGRWRYLVVNHGGREKIELFEVHITSDEVALQWRGCISPAEDTYMNDVVGLANGDVIYSKMFRASDSLAMAKSVIGIKTGDLWRWNKQGGLRVLPGTQAAQPNGLEISADDRYVFANMYMEKQVWKVDAQTGEVVAVADIANADNSAWGDDGRLWVVTHTGSLLAMSRCFDDAAIPCPPAFAVIALDPDTMASETLFTHEGAPMGAATIAVPAGDKVYIGSFAGDRMLVVPGFGSAVER